MTTDTCLGIHNDGPNFSAAREAHYTLLSGVDIGQTGTVAIANITSNGILFASGHQFALAQRLELSICWPTLKLVVRGQVVQADQCTALFCIGQNVRSLPVKPTICELARIYLVIWRRVGGHETFRHRVVASSEEEAFLVSRGDISQALGPNAELWELGDVRRQSPGSART